MNKLKNNNKEAKFHTKTQTFAEINKEIFPRHKYKKMLSEEFKDYLKDYLNEGGYVTKNSLSLWCDFDEYKIKIAVLYGNLKSFEFFLEKLLKTQNEVKNKNSYVDSEVIQSLINFTNEEINKLKIKIEKSKKNCMDNLSDFLERKNKLNN